jgi:polar amino acid transport system substrate-binding protein
MRLVSLLLVACALLVVACGEEEAERPAATQGGATARACAPDRLDLVQAGRLTVGTDKPAYPPYFVDDDPTNGRGFESAVAYAVAQRLGFGRDQVEWVTVPFNSSYAPGPKRFDFDINQVSITPQRARRVDFSEPYYRAPQAVVAPSGSTVADATALADLRDAQIGVQIGTTSLDAVRERIRPTEQPQVFSDSNDVVRAVEAERVEAIVVDLPTAFFLTAAELEDAKIVGQFEAPAGDEWGLVLERGSSLTRCVNRALAALRSSGELGRLTERWMGGQAGAPRLR